VLKGRKNPNERLCNFPFYVVVCQSVLLVSDDKCCGYPSFMIYDFYSNRITFTMTLSLHLSLPFRRSSIPVPPLPPLNHLQHLYQAAAASTTSYPYVLDLWLLHHLCVPPPALCMDAMPASSTSGHPLTRSSHPALPMATDFGFLLSMCHRSPQHMPPHWPYCPCLLCLPICQSLVAPSQHL
jgi:hypothetical protein